MPNALRLEWTGTWQELKGRARSTWGQLTDDDVAVEQGDYDQLVGRIKRRTGETEEVIAERLLAAPGRLKWTGSWEELKGRARSTWGQLTDDDVNVAKGDYEQLAGRIKQRTGLAIDEIYRQLASDAVSASRQEK
jgi:uncharacterized protein YjbJ (UPF0337 family)